MFATLNTTTNNWDAIAYVLVGSAVGIDTYSTGSLTTPTETFTTNTSGAVTVYVGATGLNPLHNYAAGIEDQLTGFCVFTAPSSSQTSTPSNLCKLSTATLTGTQPTSSGQFVANWGVTLASGTTPPQGGTYMATIYDQTGGQRVASRLFSIIDGRATGSAARVNLEFRNDQGTSAAGITRIAWDGTSTNVDDTNVTYTNLLFGATTLPNAAHNYRFVVTDPNGNIAKKFTVNNPGSTTVAPAGQSWGLPDPAIPFRTRLPRQHLDRDRLRCDLEQARRRAVLSNPGIFGLRTLERNLHHDCRSDVDHRQPHVYQHERADLRREQRRFDQGVLFEPSCGPVLQQNSDDAAGNRGPLHAGDGAPCTETISDTSGNSWTATLTCTAGFQCPVNPTYTIDLTPVSLSTPLQPGASVTVQGPTIYTSNCTGVIGCYFQNAVYPTDGLGGSGGYYVAQLANATATVGGGSATLVFVAGYYDSSNTWHASQDLYTPRFNQASLVLNQTFTGAVSSVVYGFTVKNTSTYTLQILGIGFPAAYSVTNASADSHTPNAFTMTATGLCDTHHFDGVCITPTTSVPASGTQTYYIKIAPPSSSFSYTDTTPYIISDSYNNPDFTQMTPATASVNTFIGRPTTVNSTALGAYTLDGGLMIGEITPSTVGTSTTNPLSFMLQNTTTGSDPFPDYVDMAVVQIPTSRTSASRRRAAGSPSIRRDGRAWRRPAAADCRRSTISGSARSKPRRCRRFRPPRPRLGATI